jgi:hypothetical protein
MIYFGQLIGVGTALFVQFYLYGYFGPFFTIFGFAGGCYLTYLNHVKYHSHDRNRRFRWLVSKKTAIIWGCIFFIGYGLYIGFHENFTLEYLIILPILSVFLGLGSGMLTAIIGDSLQLIYEDKEDRLDV